MIPNIEILTEQITEVTYPNRTYKINFSTDITKNTSKGERSIVLTMTALSEGESGAADRINGYVDDIESVIQAVYLILSTERYEFLIYSWDYGVELVDLFGKPMSYVIFELPSRIKEALTMDDRIDDVVDFEFEQNGKKLLVTFTVVSNVGNISAALEVEV